MIRLTAIASLSISLEHMWHSMFIMIDYGPEHTIDYALAKINNRFDERGKAQI